MKLCWHCEKRPAAENDLWVCDVCWQEWLTHRRPGICPVCELPIIEHGNQERKQCHDAVSGYVR
jgi:rubrerythrin